MSENVLTREAFEKWVEVVRTARPRRCGIDNPHIVSTREQAQGWGFCVSCGRPVGEWPLPEGRQ